MTIRLLNDTDADPYKALRIFSLEEAPFAFSDSSEDEAGLTTADYIGQLEIVGDPPERFTLGAFTEASELIGFVRCKRDPRTKARHRAALHNLYVHPEHRGKGIAEKLVRELTERAKRLPGVEQIQLAVLIADASPIAFYEKCGFQLLGGLMSKDLIINGRYVDATYMVKHLD